jgi:hypothetical protein
VLPLATDRRSAAASATVAARMDDPERSKAAPLVGPTPPAVGHRAVDERRLLEKSGSVRRVDDGPGLRQHRLDMRWRREIFRPAIRGASAVARGEQLLFREDVALTHHRGLIAAGPYGPEQ